TADPRAAIHAALELFLRTAGEDPLMRMLLSDDGSGNMLPFVTTQGLPVVVWATARLAAVIEEGWPQAPKADVTLLSEALVRLAISYITNPSETPDSTAASMADLLGPFIDRALGTACTPPRPPRARRGGLRPHPPPAARGTRRLPDLHPGPPDRAPPLPPPLDGPA